MMRLASVIVCLLAGLLVSTSFAGATSLPGAQPSAKEDSIARGEYLARLGNCRACHTTPGGTPYAGGRAIRTQFGTFYSPNLTPDPTSGLGRWDYATFQRALQEGTGRQGEPLYPVFPYTHFASLKPLDVRDLHAYLQSLPPAMQKNREHELRFPYSIRSLMHVWRALYFRPQAWREDSSRDAQWNRGAYLVESLTHCGACHQARNGLGAQKAGEGSGGGHLEGWYAPMLDARSEAGVAHWPMEKIVELLSTGKTDGATSLGPMASIVFESLQHASAQDLESIARYLKRLPEQAGPSQRQQRLTNPQAPARSRQRGESLFAEHCADCHGEQGQGRPPAASALRDNRVLQMDSLSNPIRVTLYGGFAPATSGNPMPFGMPPFDSALSDQDIADLLNFLRALSANEQTQTNLRMVLDHEVTRQRRRGVSR